MKALIPTDFPSGRIQYPEKLNKVRESLLVAFDEEKKCPNIRKRIELVIAGLRLLAVQMEYETALKTRALAVVMRDRQSERMLNG